jgi:hypothetical protein
VLSPSSVRIYRARCANRAGVNPSVTLAANTPARNISNMTRPYLSVRVSRGLNTLMARSVPQDEDEIKALRYVQRMLLRSALRQRQDDGASTTRAAPVRPGEQSPGLPGEETS